MKNIRLRFIITIILLVTNFISFAQPGATSDDPGGLEGGDAQQAPIGDYVWILALVGLLFVFFTIKAMNNKRILK